MPDVKIMLGADPEFELFHKERRSWEDYPQGVLRRTNKGDDGDLINARLGVDGGGDSVEIRPHQAIDSRYLVHNTRRVMRHFAKHYKDYGLSIAGHHTPLGAHFHFGITVDGQRCGSYTPDAPLLFMLDHIMGEYLMNRSGEGRGEDGDYSEYRALSQYQRNDHGFEYRTPAAIAFAKPEYVELIGRLFQATVKYYITHQNSLQRGTRKVLVKAVHKIRDKVLTAKDHKTLLDMDCYEPESYEDIVTKYWL